MANTTDLGMSQCAACGTNVPVFTFHNCPKFAAQTDYATLRAERDRLAAQVAEAVRIIGQIPAPHNFPLWTAMVQFCSDARSIHAVQRIEALEREHAAAAAWETWKDEQSGSSFSEVLNTWREAVAAVEALEKP